MRRALAYVVSGIVTGCVSITVTVPFVHHFLSP